MNLFHRSRQKIDCIVLKSESITPHMRRLLLGGPELGAWLSTPGVMEPGAWVKVFPPGVPGRAYTVRAFDLEQATLTLDLVLHGSARARGTVSSWARQAAPGDPVAIAGPRSGGFELSAQADWLWIGADATALPAAMRILESLPDRLQARAFLIVDGPEDRQPLSTRADLIVRWRSIAQGPEGMSERNVAIKDLTALSGSGQVWLAGEAQWFKRWRSYWLETLRMDPTRLSAKGYWKMGEIDYRG